MQPILWTPEEIYRDILKIGMPVCFAKLATPNFQWAELLTKQKEQPNLDILRNLFEIANILDIYREKVFKMPIIITSGWRSVNYNASIKGDSNSYHIKGMALDFVVKNWTSGMVYDVLNKIHCGGLEIGKSVSGDWIHCDCGTLRRFDSDNNILPCRFTKIDHDKLFYKT